MLEDGVRREFMCSDLYNAATSGNKYKLGNLLGYTKESVSHGLGVHCPCRLSEVTRKRNTVLHIAAGLGHIGLAEVVCSKDASLLLSENLRSETPLFCAAREGHHDMVSLIIRLAQEYGIGRDEVLGKKDNRGNTALHEAARHDHGKVAKVLMTAAPALASVVNQSDMSPLYVAAMRKSEGIVQTLIQYKDASFAGPNRKTALHAAVLQSRDITSMLLDWQPTLANICDDSNSTPLHYAASDSDIEIVKMLLASASSAVYLQDEHGWSPIHVAARMGHVKVIDLLIKKCPDSVEILDKQGRNFLHAGVESGRPSVAGYVRRRSGLVKLINEQDNRGNTPLHLAVLRQNSDTVFEILKAKGVQTSITNNEGHTPLDLTDRLRSSLHMIRILVALSVSGSRFSSQRQDHLKPWNAKGVHKGTEKNLTIVAVLIATIAFSVTFNVPGGYDDHGKANVGDTIQYKVFMLFDTIAMVYSVIATISLVAERALHADPQVPTFINAAFCVWIALVSMNIAFIAAAIIAMGKCNTYNFVAGLSIYAIIYLIRILYNMGRVAPIGALVQFQLRKYQNNQKHTRRRIERQYETVCPLVKGIFRLILVNLVVYVAMFIALGYIMNN
ncbi:protein ACCELERATED CELL DEATH 6-like [Typha angustifolia]|uniref:protein ACCELERATED CELL DEATH 6-like n=1 Tax=Typha angustifolia TaxID=59011 RepID=UPI003C2BEEC1